MLAGEVNRDHGHPGHGAVRAVRRVPGERQPPGAADRAVLSPGRVAAVCGTAVCGTAVSGTAVRDTAAGDAVDDRQPVGKHLAHRRLGGRRHRRGPCLGKAAVGKLGWLDAEHLRERLADPPHPQLGIDEGEAHRCLGKQRAEHGGVESRRAAAGLPGLWRGRGDTHRALVAVARATMDDPLPATSDRRRLAASGPQGVPSAEGTAFPPISPATWAESRRFQPARQHSPSASTTARAQRRPEPHLRTA